MSTDPVKTSSQEGLVYVRQFFTGPPARKWEGTYRLTSELRAYVALTSLQVVGIPLCIGVFEAAGEPTSRSPRPDNAAVALVSPVSSSTIGEGDFDVYVRTLYLVLTSLLPNSMPLRDAR
jgi:hypothetical protein